MLDLSLKKRYNKAMNKTLRKIIAIIALVMMLGFMASLMMHLIDKTLLNGAVGTMAIVTGCLALGLYLVIVFDNKKTAQKKRIEEELKKLEENPEEDRAPEDVNKAESAEQPENEKKE